MNTDDNTIRIRFVGGQLHNQLLVVHRDSYRIESAVPNGFDKTDYELAGEPYADSEMYLKISFRTEHGTLYHQFVNRDLIVNGEPLPQVYWETFPECVKGIKL